MWADRTEKYLNEAETLQEGTGYVYERAQTHLAWATYLAYQGAINESSREAAAARKLFLTLKAERDAARTAPFLNESDEEP